MEEGSAAARDRTAPETDNGPDPGTAEEDYRRLRGYALTLMDRAGERLDDSEELEPRDLKRLAGVLLDAKRLLGALPPPEREAQTLRLRQLERQITAGGEQQIMVEFLNTGGSEG